MGNILYNISQVLGITIIHSLWQGLLIYFLLRIILALPLQLTASKKYVLAITGLLAITGWFIYTLVNEIHIYNWLATVPSNLSMMPLMLNLPAGISQFNDQTVRCYYNIEAYLPYITIIYIAGLVFNGIKLIIARQKINVMKNTMSIDIALQIKVNELVNILDISRKVKIGVSKLVDVPCMVGYFKPVILLPFTLSTYLSAEEIEAIVRHELAHIKRNDYLVNLCQQLIAVLLFFNPCAQLINRIINEERENCCDDEVVGTTSNPLIYAKALLKLEQNRENNYQLAMSATGKKYQLLSRIERIMKTKKQTPSLRPALLAMLILGISVGSIALLSPEIAQGKISVKAIAPIIKNLIADTAHKSAAKKSLPIAKAKSARTTAKKYAKNYDAASDKKLAELNAEIQRHSQALDKYYSTEAFKETQRELEQKGKELQEIYDRPEMKKMQKYLSHVKRLATQLQ